MLHLFPKFRRQYIHFAIQDHLDSEMPAVARTEYPYFGFPDLYFAIQHLYENDASRVIRSDQGNDLSGLLGPKGPQSYLKVGACSTLPWMVGFEEEKFFQIDSFWLCSESFESTSVRFVVRLYLNRYTNTINVEVASSNDLHAEAVIRSIKTRATEKSIYRGKPIELAYTEEVRDAYGEQTSSEKIELTFKRNEVVSDNDIILEDGLKELIKELVFDYEEVKGQLADYHIAKKRGIILYGPPGTGKTFTTKYISGRLPHRTTLICYGQILGRIKIIANIAKLLSPTVVVLEDIDLAFSQREANYDQSNLSEFMDILDGHAAEQDVIFILNTNSLSRVEEAIKDRPGRITQCIYMGGPSSELRKRYFSMLLKNHNASLQKLDELVDATENCTQAFIKELVIRSIQKELHHSGKSDGGRIDLDEGRCLEVLTKMRSSGEASEKILGFAVD